ncbi:MAG: hypothetical protein IT537_14935 [Hyphomicrobiales bacterium]|nr:hypothetical protein [Hyphomicrobiales bacterium]
MYHELRKRGTSAAHAIRLATREPVPAEAPVGAEIDVTLQATCSAGCELRGLALTLTAPDGVARALPLTTRVAGTREASVSETGPQTLRIPPRVGPHTWTVVCPAQAGSAHSTATLTLTISATPLPASLAVWAIPEPVVAGARFTLKVGVRSSAGCALAGATVELRDADGGTVAHGALGAEPWSGTTALYWSEIAAAAPPTPGVHAWSAHFPGNDDGLPHAPACHRFELSTVAAPEHRLGVIVCDQESGAPIEGMIVRVDAFRATTDASGLAELTVPKGRCSVAVWKSGYEAPETTIDMRADARLAIAVTRLPQEDPDAAWRA